MSTTITMTSGPRPRFRPMRAILRSPFLRIAMATHARCHGDVEVNVVLRDCYIYRLLHRRRNRGPGGGHDPSTMTPPPLRLRPPITPPSMSQSLIGYADIRAALLLGHHFNLCPFRALDTSTSGHFELWPLQPLDFSPSDPYEFTLSEPLGHFWPIRPLDNMNSRTF